MPMVRRFGCCSRRGVSRVAGSRKVKGPGVARLQQPELPGVDARVARDLGEVAAHQREVMMPVGLRMRRRRSERSASPM